MRAICKIAFICACMTAACKNGNENIASHAGNGKEQAAPAHSDHDVAMAQINKVIGETMRGSIYDRFMGLSARTTVLDIMGDDRFAKVLEVGSSGRSADAMMKKYFNDIRLYTVSFYFDEPVTVSSMGSVHLEKMVLQFELQGGKTGAMGKELAEGFIKEFEGRYDKCSQVPDAFDRVAQHKDSVNFTDRERHKFLYTFSPKISCTIFYSDVGVVMIVRFKKVA